MPFSASGMLLVTTTARRSAVGQSSGTDKQHQVTAGANLAAISRARPHSDRATRLWRQEKQQVFFGDRSVLTVLVDSLGGEQVAPGPKQLAWFRC